MPHPPITAVILAGGRSRRMAGADKALLPLWGRPLVSHVAARLRPQAERLLLNTNRLADEYAPLDLPLVADTLAGQPGPLAGLLAALEASDTPEVLVAPCDMPRLPPDLVERLHAALESQRAEVACPHDGTRLQQAVMLARRELAPALRRYLEGRGRRVQGWLEERRLAVVDFADQADAFVNVNTPQELARLARPWPAPVVGFAAWSGSGKTTLLERLIPALRARGRRPAVLKHAHHAFDIDIPGKDSYRLRHAGADQVLVASARRWALMTETPEAGSEPALETLLPHLDFAATDLVLVEGFKHAHLPKVEVHRPALGKPPIFPDDPEVIAVAGDAPPQVPCDLPQLPLDDAAAVAEFLDRTFPVVDDPAVDTETPGGHNNPA